LKKKYNTPHRCHVVKTRMTEEEYADFTKAILRLTRRSFTKLLQAPTVRTGRFCGFPVRPGRIASGSATFS